MSRKAFLLLIVRIDSTSFIGGDCLKSQISLSENRESASGLVWGYGVFQSCEDFSDSLGWGASWN